MESVQNLGLYAKYFNFFVINYSLWSVILCSALIYLWSKYRKANLNEQIKFKKPFLLITIIFIFIIVYFFVATVRSVDEKQRTDKLYQKHNPYSSLTY